MTITDFDWNGVDHVMLDMDGTILDLAFDNQFWRQHVPRRYAVEHGLSLETARADLEPQFEHWQGKLQWYCLEHWGHITSLDLKAMKQELAHDIQPLPGAEDFLRAVKQSGRSFWLVTNAHRDSLDVKLAATGIGLFFDEVISSHDFGHPKEAQEFWSELQNRFPFDPARSLFVDDSLSVLRSAREFGIAQLIAIAHPDSSEDRRLIDEFRSVDRLQELLPTRPLTSA